MHIFPLGPNALLSVITGELIIAGLISMFIDWKIGITFIIGGFLVTKFRIWGNKKNHEFFYHEKNKNDGNKEGKEYIA